MCVIVPICTENPLRFSARLGGEASEVHFEAYRKAGGYTSATAARWGTL
jgi:hypothetical protein